MAGLKAVFLKKLSMTAYAMGRYAITRRKTRAGAVVPKIHVRRSVVALIAGDSTTPVGSLSQQERDSSRPTAHATAPATNIRHCRPLVTPFVSQAARSPASSPSHPLKPRPFIASAHTRTGRPSSGIPFALESADFKQERRTQHDLS